MIINRGCPHCRHSGVRASRRDVLNGLATAGASMLLPGGARAQGAAASAPASNGRIDVHYHIFPPEAAASRNSAQAAWTPARALEEMERNGIATGIASSGSSIRDGDPKLAARRAREFNEFAVALAGAHPGCFGLFAALPMPDIDASLQEVTYAYDVLKADGIGLLTSYDELWLGDRKFRPLFEELNRRSAVVYVHPTDAPCCINMSYQAPPVLGSWIEWPMHSARAIFSLMLNKITREFPGIRFIFAHDGGTMPMLVGRIAGMAQNSRPEFRERFRELFPDGVEAEYRKLYFDTAQGFHPVNMEAMRRLVPEAHILFGTDYPYFSMRESVQGLQKLGLPPALLRAIERENAQALLPRWQG